MASHDLLRLLDALDNAELQVDFLIDYLEDFVRDDPPYEIETEQIEASETMRQLRHFVRQLVRTKEMLPDARLSPALVDLQNFAGGESRPNLPVGR